VKIENKTKVDDAYNHEQKDIANDEKEEKKKQKL
jgi:hypothetical protein